MYAGCDNNVLATDTSGNLLLTLTLGGNLQGRPVITNGVLYAATDAGILYAFGLGGTPQVEAPAPTSLKPDLSLPLSRSGR